MQLLQIQIVRSRISLYRSLLTEIVELCWLLIRRVIFRVRKRLWSRMLDGPLNPRSKLRSLVIVVNFDLAGHLYPLTLASEAIFFPISILSSRVQQ